jgi:hypothetical protein
VTTTRRPLWVVCPVYKDVESFLQLRENVLAAVAGVVSSVRFVVVDDTAGQDPAMSRLQALADVTVVTPPFNLGHQRALVFGLRRLSGQIQPDDLVVTMDSDGEDQPQDIPRLLEPLLTAAPSAVRPQTVVLARRTRRREALFFKVLYFFFKLLFRGLTGLVIRTGNFAAYRGSVPREVLFHPHFDACYSSSLLSLNLPIVYVPCERGRRYAGRSQMSQMRLFMHGIRMLMPFLDRIAIRSLFGFSFIFIVGILLALVVVGVRLFTELAIPGWATYTLLLILTLSFVALGNFVILFTLFSQSQSVALASLDRDQRSAVGGAPAPVVNLAVRREP